VTDIVGPTDTRAVGVMKRNPTQAAKGRTNVLPFVFVGVTLRAKGPLAAATVAAYVGARQVHPR
jgi:hypothetical protein